MRLIKITENYFFSDCLKKIEYSHVFRHLSLTLNFPMALVNTLNTKTHTSKEMAEFSFENADVKKNVIANRG